MSQKKICRKVGIVGATGMVGKSFLSLLEGQKLNFEELRLFASENSEGQTRDYLGKKFPVLKLGPECFRGLDLVFFSSGDDISEIWAPQAKAQGAWVVDNSAAFRMKDNLLVVPEVNGSLLNSAGSPQIIANPNCSTIQLVVALKPLADAFGLEEVIVSSYQAVSGGGQKAQEELVQQVKTLAAKDYQQGSQPLESQMFPHQIAFNCIPQVGSFGENGFSSEEMKIMLETRKILGLPSLTVSATAVRVPVMNAHAESVWVKLKQKVDRSSFLAAMKAMKGLEIFESQTSKDYPTQVFASGKGPVFVGRIHQDLFDDRRWIFWVVADNILKGAALNGLQIAEAIFDFDRRP